MKLFNLAIDNELKFSVKIVLTDTNFFPRSSYYYLTVVVPKTTYEKALENEAYDDELTADFESKVTKSIDEPGKIDTIQVSMLGVLRISFTTPLVDDEAANQIA